MYVKKVLFTLLGMTEMLTRGWVKLFNTTALLDMSEF